jgi:AraC family transcriptional regulator
VPEVPTIKLQEPRLQDRRALLVAGLQEHYTPETMNSIPALWKRLPFGRIPGQLGHMAYGIVYNVDPQSKGFDYFCGVEVAAISPANANFKSNKVPSQKYAIFCHREHVSKLRNTIDAIFSTWLPTSGQTHARPTPASPDLVEYYGENFDPESGTGDMEVWLPIKS